MHFGHTIRRPAFLAVTALAIVTMFALLSATSATPAQAASCGQSSFNGGYFTSLSVTKTSCSNGKKIARGFQKCRLRNGGKDGRCNSRVSGYRCKESGRRTTSTEINAKVTCRKGSAKIVFTYQQNL